MYDSQKWPYGCVLVEDITGDLEPHDFLDKITNLEDYFDWEYMLG